MQIFIVQSRDGSAYARAFDSRESFLALYDRDYLSELGDSAEARKLRVRYENAATDATQHVGTPADLGDGDSLIVVAIETA
jgi:lipopolysaccharide export system protein LptA